MEIQKIIGLIGELKTAIQSASLSAIDKDLAKQKLAELYELLLTENKSLQVFEKAVEVPVEPKKEEPVAPPVVVKEEIVPPPAPKVEPKPVAKESPDTENLNESFESENSTLNDRFQLKVNRGLNERVTQGDLKKLIDFNRQFVFIQELFNNDATAYMNAIEKLNTLTTVEDAFEFLNKEIVHIYKWKPDQQSVKLFDKIVRQKFGL